MTKSVELKNGSLENLQEALRYCLSHSADARYGLRLVCLVLVTAGFSCSTVGRWFGKTGRTVQRWVEAFQKDGIEGLKEEHRPGRVGTFSTEVLARRGDDLRHPPKIFGLEAEVWDSGLLAEHVKRRYGHGLGTRQAQRLLIRLHAGSVLTMCKNATFISGPEDEE